MGRINAWYPHNTYMIMSASTVSRTITIFVKSMSGDLFPVEVAPSLSTAELYRHVYDALPEEVKPQELWQLTLLRSLPDEEEKGDTEIHETSSPCVPDLSPSEVLFLLQEGRDLYACIGDEDEAVEEDLIEGKRDDGYSVGYLRVFDDDTLLIKHPYLHDTFLNTYAFMDEVVEGRWVRDHKEKIFLFQFPEKGPRSFRHARDPFLQLVISRLEGFSARTKAYFVRKWKEEMRR